MSKKVLILGCSLTQGSYARDEKSSIKESIVSSYGWYDSLKCLKDLEIDVFAFGIASDFRTELFPGSARLFELADRIQVLQVEALCWCGRRGTHHARPIDGVMVTEGEQVAVGDTGGDSGVVSYEVLCRRHHMAAMPINHLAD